MAWPFPLPPSQTAPDCRIPAWIPAGLSLLLQLALAPFFGHAYDLRIFLATGVLVATGRDPYLQVDLSALFHNPSFHGITTVGYPPPWPLILGVLYRIAGAALPDLRFYTLAIKLPVIAANLGLAFLVRGQLERLGAGPAAARRAWLFLLFNPFLLFATAAWGQFDSLVALLALAALACLAAEKCLLSAALLALAVAFKPTAMSLLLVGLLYLKGRPARQVLGWYGMVLAGLLLFCVVPFWLFRWDPSPILQNWNAHFMVGGGLSLLTFVEPLRDSYRLPGAWWLVGLAWVPALVAVTFLLRRGVRGERSLLLAGAVLVLTFFLARAWLSEPNLVLALPLVLILVALDELDGLALAAVWILPLVFSLLNTAAIQLLFPSLPQLMARLLAWTDTFRGASLAGRIVVAAAWQLAGWWVVINCVRKLRRGT